MFFFRFIPNSTTFTKGFSLDPFILKTADQISIGQTAIVKEIIDSPFKLNLMELGFMPGKAITLKHSAPLGGPMAFQIDETILALRKNEAALIEVQLP